MINVIDCNEVIGSAGVDYSSHRPSDSFITSIHPISPKTCISVHSVHSVQG